MEFALREKVEMYQKSNYKLDNKNYCNLNVFTKEKAQNQVSGIMNIILIGLKLCKVKVR